MPHGETKSKPTLRTGLAQPHGPPWGCPGGTLCWATPSPGSRGYHTVFSLISSSQASVARADWPELHGPARSVPPLICRRSRGQALQKEKSILPFSFGRVVTLHPELHSPSMEP